MSIIKKLKNEKPYDLFRRARCISQLKDTKFSFTIIISKKCNIKPLCRHCEWVSSEHFSEHSNARISLEELLKSGEIAEDLGVDRIVIPSGWKGLEVPNYFYDYINELVSIVNVDVWCAFGAVNKKVLYNLREVGVKGYSCGIETTNRKVFETVRPGDNWNDRVRTLENSRDLGLGISSSLVIGIGESIKDRAKGIRLLKDLGVNSAAIWPFCPSPYTEMEKLNAPSHFDYAKTLATMTLELKGADILGDTRAEKLKWSIRAGSNLFPARNKIDMDKIIKMRDNLNIID